MADEDNTVTPTVLSKTTRLKTRVRYPKIRLLIDAKRINDVCNCTIDRCVIKEAIAEAYHNLINITVDLRTIVATDVDQNLRFTWMTPLLAGKCLLDIDQGLHPNPFLLRLGKPIYITRSGGQHRYKSPEERRSEDASRKREYRKAKKLMTMQESENATEQQKEYASKIVASMKKRNAPLGTAVGMRAANASNGSSGIIVGGRPPRVERHPHLLRTRRFGLRSLKDNPT